MRPYIVIGGPLASGKTTTARLMAEHMHIKMLLENVATHPLIDDFYADPKAYTLQTEMIFTIMHYHDIAKALKEGLFNEAVVSDLFFDGVEAYTSFTLTEGDKKAFVSLLRLLQERVPTPTQVLFLDASTEFLMERVKSRGRDYEKTMTFEYLDGVNKAFKAFIKEYRRAPVVVLDAERLYAQPHEKTTKELEELVGSAILGRD